MKGQLHASAGAGWRRVIPTVCLSKAAAMPVSQLVSLCTRASQPSRLGRRRMEDRHCQPQVRQRAMRSHQLALVIHQQTTGSTVDACYCLPTHLCHRWSAVDGTAWCLATRRTKQHCVLCQRSRHAVDAVASCCGCDRNIVLSRQLTAVLVYAAGVHNGSQLCWQCAAVWQRLCWATGQGHLFRDAR